MFVIYTEKNIIQNLVSNVTLPCIQKIVYCKRFNIALYVTLLKNTEMGLVWKTVKLHSQKSLCVTFYLNNFASYFCYHQCTLGCFVLDFILFSKFIALF